MWPIKVTPTFEEDATPEYITVTDDNKYAYIILQVKLITSHIYEPYIYTLFEYPSFTSRKIRINTPFYGYVEICLRYEVFIVNGMI